MTWPDQGAAAAGGNGESLGQRAERSVHERLRARPVRRLRPPPERLVGRPVARRLRPRGRGGHRRRPPGQGLPDHRGQGRPDRPRQPRPLVGRQPPAGPAAVRAGCRQPPQPRRQAARAAGLAGRPGPDRRPRRRVPQRRGREPRHEGLRPGHERGPGPHPRQGDPGPGGAAQPADPRLGRRLLRAVGGRREAGARAEGHRAPPGDDHLAARAPDAAPLRDRRREPRDRPRDGRAALPPRTRCVASGGRRSSAGPGPARRCWPWPRPASSRRRASRPCWSASTRRWRGSSRTRPATSRSGPGTSTSARSTSSPRTSRARRARCRPSRSR